jgi:imidazolonepropionase-like amidohydrolase
MCVRHGVDVIYHASYIDDEGMDMLEEKKTKHVVAPGINWLIATRTFFFPSYRLTLYSSPG